MWGFECKCFFGSEDGGCLAQEDLGIQLEEWESSEEKQEAPAIEDTLLFESEKRISYFSVSVHGVYPLTRLR